MYSMISCVKILSEIETRVLGSLVEKELTTPGYYPLPLNALVNVCNPKSNRDPAMTLDDDALRMVAPRRGELRHRHTNWR
jgi:uncharacterized protein YceH (UPF0502 family)